MHRTLYLASLITIFLLASCNPYKYVPEGQFMLKKVTLEKEGNVPKLDFNLYLHQTPNSRFLNLIGVNLFIYNLSGKDTTKWINRTLRNIGEEPVIFDDIKNERSRSTLESLLVNNGYYQGKVAKDVRFKKKKAYVSLILKPNKPYTVKSIEFEEIPEAISTYTDTLKKASDIKPGILLSSEALDGERKRIVSYLQSKGFYAMQKEHIYFSVDSTLGNNQARIKLKMKTFETDTTISGLTGKDMRDYAYTPYKINTVYFMLGVDMSSFNRRNSGSVTEGPVFQLSGYDTIVVDGYKTVYKSEPFIDPKALISNCRMVPGDVYDVEKVNRTYTRLNALQYMKYVNIRFVELPADAQGNRLLDCYIVLSSNAKQGIGFDLEGTNTAGDFGVAGNAVYTHRNLLNGSELFQFKVRGAYEALSANFESDYKEIGGEMNLTFPEFKMPFLSSTFKQKVDASTEWRTAYQIMIRPEFKRTVASMGVRYNWSETNRRHTLDLFDMSYLYMPRVDSTFKANYLNNTSYLKYSYQDQFILRSGYSFAFTSAPNGGLNRTYHTWKGSFESAGNLLYAAYAITGSSKDQHGFYKIGNINFSQYLKGELEFAKSTVLNSKSRLAYRVGLGLAYPYGNASILPFEKRFYAGGANSVRGWSVRTVGPGTYKNTTGRIDFMNQSGDVKLDLNLEYRGNLFWVLEGALFADAGNIWTLRDYSDQPGGRFELGNFYKTMAGSIGMGLRFNFNYFLLRVDCGMKVYDPSLIQSDPWRIRQIDQWNDFAMHFAVGYPF